MRIQAIVQNRLAKTLFNPNQRDKKRNRAERGRRNQSLGHVVEFFHEVSDPYSHLLVQVLSEFQRRYNVDLKVHIVGPPPDWAAPDRDRLQSYSRIDAERLASRAGLSFFDPKSQPPKERMDEANAALLAALDDGVFFDRARQIGDRYWNGGATNVAMLPSTPLSQVLERSAQRRDRLGHYLGGTLYYAGEWYWGLDRLHFLEERLRGLEAHSSGAPSAYLFQPPIAVKTSSPRTQKASVKLHWYLSFRSPYTGIVAERVKSLANAYGAELELKYVLPMVMRGMQVPRKKGFYIMSDVMREAERMNIKYGDIYDPVGKPVERGYAILKGAMEMGQGYEFAQSFLAGVWRDGIDAGSDRGLQKITERAGLQWVQMKPLIGSDDWREEAEANRQEMFDHGVWGVPSFRVGDVTAWGQDRLWVIEDALRNNIETEGV